MATMKFLCYIVRI